MESEILSVTGQFNLSFKNVKRPAHDGLSRLFVLDEKYVLKAKEISDGTVEEFKKQISILEKVRKLIPYQLPNPRKAVNGQRFVISNDSLWTVYQYIKGKIICSWQELDKANDSETEGLMKALRNLHDLTKGKFKVREIDFFLRDVKGKYEDVKDMLSSDVQKRIMQAMRNVRNASGRFKSDELCFVHGDFHHGNALVEKKGRIAGFIDLDWCRIGHPLEDLAYTVMMFLRQYASKTFQFNQRHFQKLLKWYNLDKKLLGLFKEYFILYALYDVYIFRHASNLKNKEFYLDYQLSFLEAVSDKF